MALPTVFTSGDVFTASNANLLRSNQYNKTTSTKTANYVLVAADVGTRVLMNAAGSTTITVNTSLFAAGDTLEISNIGAGVCTITSGTCTVTSSSSLALAQYVSGTLFFTSASAAIFIGSAITVTSKIAQVVQATSGTEVTTTSTSFVTAGLAVTITPTLNTSSVLVMCTTPGQSSTATGGAYTLFRGTVAGTNLGQVNNGFATVSPAIAAPVAVTYLDAPATSSAQTYTLGMRALSAGPTIYAQLNTGRGSIIAIEVLA